MTSHERGIGANLSQFSQQTVQVFLVGLIIGMERTVLPALSERFGVPPGSYLFLAGFVISFGIVKGLLNFFAGAWSDRRGRKPVLFWGWLAALPIPLLILFAQNWWWIIAANVFLGINQGFAWTMTVTSQVDLAGGARRGLAVGINESIGYIAVGIAGVATGYLAARFGPREALFGFGIAVTVLGLLGTWLLVRETLPWARAEQAALAASPETRLVHGTLAAMTADPSGWDIFRLVSFRHPTYRALAQAGTVNKIADALVWILYPVYLRLHGLALAQIGWVTGMYAMVWGLSQLFTGHLSDRVGRKLPVVAGLWLLGLGIAATALAHDYHAWLACAAVMGLGMALLYPNLIAAVADISPPAWRGRALGVYRYWRDTGYAIGALLLGGVVQWSHDLVPAFWVTAGLLLISGFWILWAVQETRHQD